MSSASIFKALIESTKSRRTAAIFDLDSTLYDVSYRTQAILSEFLMQADISVNYANEFEFLKKIQIESGDWGLRDRLERAGFQSTDEFHKMLRAYWRKYFFSSDFLHIDKPYLGAIDYVQSLRAAGAEIYYLTGRDELNMQKGSVASLRQHGFPLDDEKHLYMKPIKGSSEDEDFKDIKMREILADLRGSGRTTEPGVWFFDNEPVIMNKLIASKHPIELVWIDTVHASRGEPPRQLPTITPPWRK